MADLHLEHPFETLHSELLTLARMQHGESNPLTKQWARVTAASAACVQYHLERNPPPPPRIEPHVHMESAAIDGKCALCGRPEEDTEVHVEPAAHLGVFPLGSYRCSVCGSSRYAPWHTDAVTQVDDPPEMLPPTDQGTSGAGWGTGQWVPLQGGEVHTVTGQLPKDPDATQPVELVPATMVDDTLIAVSQRMAKALLALINAWAADEDPDTADVTLALTAHADYLAWVEDHGVGGETYDAVPGDQAEALFETHPEDEPPPEPPLPSVSAPSGPGRVWTRDDAEDAHNGREGL